MRLQGIRPEWPWKEDVRPDQLSANNSIPIADVQQPGIYNRAVLVLAEASPFTQGLEQELRDLTKISQANYADTALGRWIHRSPPASQEEASYEAQPLLEVLPMNSEQRQAVRSALTRSTTIITGPPGTGKSQVVTNLLINAAWMGKRVLFASKNNKAVDVVETRVNALGSRPVLLRVGSQSYQARLAEYVLALLSATTTKSDHDEFEEARHLHERLVQEQTRLAREAESLINLRNEVDRLEQNAEEARRRLGASVFAQSPSVDLASVEGVLRNVEGAADKADRSKAPLLASLFWPFIRASKIQLLARAVDDAAPTLATVGVASPLISSETQVHEVRTLCGRAREIAADISASAEYLRHLGKLRSSRSLEEIARDETQLLDRLARHSKQLWVLWLKLQPTKLSASDRQRLGRYTAILKMVIEAGEEGQLTPNVRSQYRKLLKEIAHLLPCWAVTSLSARGRIPFEPGVFDIVVFDEASQCDIASALPLLYRAKSVVVIGDPSQLSHISGLQKGQDQALLDKYGLVENFPEWAYSYQALFSLGATQVSGEEIVSLVDHHRSHADIINFSNAEFYEKRLRVATRYDRLRSPAPNEPGIRWVDVRGRVVRPATGGALNRNEVGAVVEVLKDLVLRRGYQGTVGLVSPFRAQANAITEAINGDDSLSVALARLEFIADTVHKFQGDERDVMIFSPVVAADCPPGALSFLRNNPNLFNVAITRARAQLIVVGDNSACSQSGVDYLSRFAQYTATLDAETTSDVEYKIHRLGADYPVVARPELVSEWERYFYSALYSDGLRPIPQYPVEKYVLDFLLVSGDRRLAIEVDGERYHRNWSGELCRRDQIRNQRLFELGYDVMRFWVYEIRDDIDGCRKRVRTWASGAAAKRQIGPIHVA